MSTFTTVRNKTFKLIDGQLLDHAQLGQALGAICHYVHNVVLVQKGAEIIALIFPSTKLLLSPDYEKTPEEGCFCPRDVNEFGRCIAGCVHSLNMKLDAGSDKIGCAVIVKEELSLEEGTLLPDTTISEENVINKYAPALTRCLDRRGVSKEEILVLQID